MRKGTFLVADLLCWEILVDTGKCDGQCGTTEFIKRCHTEVCPVPHSGERSGLLMMQTRKLVIVGDGACGKTSLLSVFTLGYFPKVHSPPFSTLILMTRTTYDCVCVSFKLTGSNRLCLTITFQYVELTDERCNSQYGTRRIFPHTCSTLRMC